jgi:hypothetical protein
MLRIARSASASNRDRMQAVGWLADRSFGRNSVLDNPLGPNGYPMIDTDKLTDAELELMIEILEKASPNNVNHERRRAQ